MCFYFLIFIYINKNIMYENINESLSENSIDKLLDKIIDVGYKNLTDKEKDMLNNPHKYDDEYFEYYDKPIIHDIKSKNIIKIFNNDDFDIYINDDYDKAKTTYIYIQYKEIPINSILNTIIIKFNRSLFINKINKPDISKLIYDIYDNSLYDENYINYIKNTINKNDIKKFNDYFSLTMIPISQIYSRLEEIFKV